MSLRAAVLAFPGMSPFHLSVPCMVLGERFGAVEVPAYDVTVCAESPGRLLTNAGFDLGVDAGLDAFRGADLVVVPSWDVRVRPSDDLLSALTAAHERGATVVSLCLGAYVVAASGIAAGREVVTHWASADHLARRHPDVRVRADVLWLDHGDLVTSAGTAASLDCCLHLVRRSFGAATAARVAHAIVTAPHRSGSQAQHIPIPVTDVDDTDPLESAMAWARANLGEPLDLDGLARRAAMSRRSFTRHFRARTGMSSQQWLLHQRVLHARFLLETTEHGVDQIADASGLGTGANLRHHFRRAFGTSPHQHRLEFRLGAGA
ncbi:MAG: helix-turn-helix domain-containing protein [Nocardioides sp.]